MFTWEELGQYINQRVKDDPSFLREAVHVATDMGEFIPVADVLESLDDDIMDDGTPYLQLEELPE